MADYVDSARGTIEDVIGMAMAKKELLLKGFGVAMGVIFLITGVVYLGLTYYLKPVQTTPCDENLTTYGYAMGALYLLCAYATMQMTEGSKTATFTLAVAAAAALILRVWGFYIMLNEEGMLCRAVGGSRLWLAMMVLSIVNLAGFGKLGI